MTQESRSWREARKSSTFSRQVYWGSADTVPLKITRVILAIIACYIIYRMRFA